MRKVSAFSALILAIAALIPTIQAAQPTPVPTPTPYPALQYLPTPAPMPTLPTTTSLPPLPTPQPATTISPTTSGTPAPTPIPTATPSPTRLPDGSMPWVAPPMPTPVLQDASTLSDQLNVPLPAPTQSSERLTNRPEDAQLKSSDQLAMKQKMVMADFEKDLTVLIAKQRNPNVADLSLNDAVQIALKENPDVLNAIQQIRLTRGELIQVVSAAIPQVAITSSYVQQANALATNGQQSQGNNTLQVPTPTGPVILNLGSGSRETQNQAWDIEFQASQLIFDGGATIAGIKAGNASYDSAFFTLRATIDNIVSQVIAQFYQVVLDRALIVAQEQNVTLLGQQVKDQQNRYDAGTVPRFNVLQAEVALANAQPPLIQAKNSYRIALYQMVKLLGMDYPTGRPSEVPFNVVGTLGYNPQKIDTDESIRIAVARNPGLKAQRQTILANAANVSAQLAGYLPTIKANGGYEVVNNPSSSDLTDVARGWFFGGTGTWNIFDGGLTYGKVAQAKAQMMQSKNVYDNGVRQVVLDVQQSISNLQQATETIESQTASVVQATEALRLSKERLDAGAGTQLDVLNAQVQLLQSQTNVLQARYNYIAAMASYDLALSVDTQYVETFDDPLAKPLNPQALNHGERNHFQKITKETAPQPPLPHAFRGQDPIKPILATPAATPAPKGKPTPKPKPTPKGKPSPTPAKNKSDD